MRTLLLVLALAHHGWAGYLDAEFEIRGTVEVPVSLAGPHATMTIKGADGHQWLLTSGCFVHSRHGAQTARRGTC